MSPFPADREGITRLLHDWQAGHRPALDRLIPIVEGELRRLARFHMRAESPDNSLQPTALVNEVYLRLAALKSMDWKDRAHFFAMASHIMRNILVDAARARHAGKRGHGAVRVNVDDVQIVDPRTDGMPDIVELDAALTALASLDERKARVVELRFFGGLTIEEAADVLGVSVETVNRDWRSAKLWLRRKLSNRG